MAENIIQALAEVMQQVGYVQKKRSGGVRYTYASETDFIEAIRPWFLEYGIVVYPIEVRECRQDAYVTSGGATMQRTVVVMTYRFSHAPSDTHIDVMVTGEGADVGDKSANKALTGAYKYALRQALLIETGDDPDKDPSEGPAPKDKAPKKAQAAPKDEPKDSHQAYWGRLSDEERGVYRSLSNLVPGLVKNSKRYDNEFAARSAILKLFPKLDEDGWPGGRTREDGKLRVTIYRKVLAYAQLRNAGMDESRALAGAEDQVKNNYG